MGRGPRGAADVELAAVDEARLCCGDLFKGVPSLRESGVYLPVLRDDGLDETEVELWEDILEERL